MAIWSEADSTSPTLSMVELSLKLRRPLLGALTGLSSASAGAAGAKRPCSGNLLAVSGLDAIVSRLHLMFRRRFHYQANQMSHLALARGALGQFAVNAVPGVLHVASRRSADRIKTASKGLHSTHGFACY